METIKTGLAIVVGWIVMFWLFDIYVIQQAYLIASPVKLMTIIVVGALVGFFFSLLETALMKIGDTEGALITASLKSNKELLDAGTRSVPDYDRERKKLERYLDLYSNRDDHVGPLVILSNVANVAVAALIPAALHTSAMTRALHIDLTWLNIPHDTVSVYGVGTRSLTIFSSALAILVIGKVVPKTVGGHEKCRYWLFKKFSPVIRLVSFAFSWLSTAINTPVKAAMKLLN